MAFSAVSSKLGLLGQTTKLCTTMSKCKYSDYAQFSKILAESKNIIALTGAGVSAESGIPVFRGPGGFWRTHRATDLATPQAFRANPALVWEFYHYRRTVAFNCQPNPAHIALAELEKNCSANGKTLHVITQNVDGLHIVAGSQNVLELHGSLRKVICTKCKHIDVNTDQPICKALEGRGDPNLKDASLPIIRNEELPKCKKCNSLVRPYIVWFGENLDAKVLHKAKELVENCDLCMVIGTSSVVYPAAMFAPLVAERGKPVAEFNLNQEPASDDFSFHFCGPCGETLPKALQVN